MRNNDELVDYLISSGVLKTKAIIEAFKKVDRIDFVLPEFKNEAYNDYPLPIGYGQTISQPWTVAFMLELLQPQRGEKILDIGFGSGWTTSLLASIVGEKGRVYGVEIIPEIYEYGKKNIEKYDFLKKGIVKLILGDGSIGLPEEAPFNRILVSAAAEGMKIINELERQLKENGIIVIPTQDGKIWRIIKKKQGSEREYFEGFAFVPLIEKQ